MMKSSKTNTSGLANTAPSIAFFLICSFCLYREGGAFNVGHYLDQSWRSTPAFVRWVGPTTPKERVDRSLVGAPTALWAKKKNSAASAALEALEAMEAAGSLTAVEEPLTAKEKKDKMKKNKKGKSDDDDDDDDNDDAPAATASSEKKKSKKDEMLAKALAMEATDDNNNKEDESSGKKKKLSKKELLAAALENEADILNSDHHNSANAVDLGAKSGVVDGNGKADKKLSKKEQLLAQALAMEDLAVAEPILDSKSHKKVGKKLLEEDDEVKLAHSKSDETASVHDEVKGNKEFNKKAQALELETGSEEGASSKPERSVEQKEPPVKMSRKEEMLMKALELEAIDDQRTSDQDEDDDSPKLSKKELKALKKKEEKMAEKMAAKLEKKKNKKAADDVDGLESDDNDEAQENAVELQVEESSLANIDGESEEGDEEVFEEGGVTLEDKIRKERPPPRIRVMESNQPGYTSLRLENVGITFRNQQVLKDVTWGVQTGDRIGLVGANGAGKTTQLRILSGELEPTTGDVVKSSKNVRVAVLRQEFIDELLLERTLKEEFLSVFEEENAILQDLKAAEYELERLPPEESDKMQEILDRMQDLQNKAEDMGVYILESRVQKVMDLMGFIADEADDLVASFSGGWKMRIGLGKVLLKDPNVLLLDEPTNHLDLESVEWLEKFLRQQNIPMVIVSHDREFLDQVCTKIVDAEGGICTEYDGNYSRFLELKKARMDAWHAAYNAQEKKLKEEREWISKFKLKQPQAVQQREAKLEKFLKSDEYVKKPPFLGKPFKFRFPDGPRLSPEVAEVKKMSHSYRNEHSQNRLFDQVDLFIEKGDRIAVVGPNGSGKSTLLRLLTGRETPDEGGAGIVGANVVANYFEQNQADVLDLDKTVLETIQASSNGQSYNELRAYLGQFLFKGDSVEKKVRNLSGGEKARLSLCCMMLRPANFLILDEPTNHLDIPAKEMLEEALQYYNGAVLIVSHDRFFISRVATSIVAIEDKKLVKYAGDYKYYLERSKEIREKVEARYIEGLSKIESAPKIDLEELQKPKKNFGGSKDAHLVNRKDKGVKNAKRLQVK